MLQDALHRECRFDTSTCDLEVKNQIAYVYGSVETLSQKRAIERAAASVPGVKGVINDLRIAPLSPHSDTRLASEVRAALSAAGLSAPLPQVKVTDGVVFLSGKVGTLDARKMAEDVAWSVPGVQYVVNDTTTTITPPCSRRAGQPEKMLRDVRFALERSLESETANVTADIQGGIVYLRGYVRSERQKFLTEDAVRWVPCVVDVVNELTVDTLRLN